jgi:MFS family permease
MSIFFVVSCAVQALSGFVVDRFGPRPICSAGWRCSGSRPSASRQPELRDAGGVLGVAGIGNGVFHPVDYTLLNRKVHPSRLGHAFSVHGITGSLGWALAPAMLVPLTLAYSWRVAWSAPACWRSRCCAAVAQPARSSRLPRRPPQGGAAARVAGSFDFLSIPAVWMCFGSSSSMRWR